MKNAYLLSSFCTAMLLVVATGYAQDEAKIKVIAEQACDCTKEISVEQPKDSIIAKINSCITTYIVHDQLAVADLVKKDTEKKASKDNTIVITADKNFAEIQAYMNDNCKSLKILMASEDIKKDHSMSKNKKALQYYNEGQDYSDEEKFDMAIVSYNKALKADSDFAFAWDNMGICYRKMGNYKEAIKCYEKSLKIDPEGKMPLLNLPVVYMLLKDYKASCKAYDVYITKFPDDPEGYFGAAKSFYLNDEYEKGLDNMFKAYRIYLDTKSPYISDAESLMRSFYADLKEKGKLDLFSEIAKKNNINIK